MAARHARLTATVISSHTLSNVWHWGKMAHGQWWRSGNHSMLKCTFDLVVQEFHGEKELFKSDHLDSVSAESVARKCRVHTMKQYQVFPHPLFHFHNFIRSISAAESLYAICQISASV